jgi:hypothetical protein
MEYWNTVSTSYEAKSYPTWNIVANGINVEISGIDETVTANTKLVIKNVGLKVRADASVTSGTFTIKTFKGEGTGFDSTHQIEQGEKAYTIDNSIKALEIVNFFPNYPSPLTPKLPAVDGDKGPISFFFRPPKALPSAKAGTTARG